MVDHGCSQARCQGFQKVLHGVGAYVRSSQQGRLIRIQLKCLDMRILLISPVKTTDNRVVMTSVNPFVGQTELALCQTRLSLNSFYSAPQLANIHSIHHLLLRHF